MSKRKKSSNKHAPQTRTGTSISPTLPLCLWGGVALIIGAVFIIYLPSISGGFIWDDHDLLTENKLVKASDGLYRFYCTAEAQDYWPVTNTSFWIEWRFWEMNSTGYHVTNLILHIAEALLIWLVLRKMSIPWAFLAVVIFAVHPVNVESVAWIAQRKNTLSMMFFLLSILWYLKAEMPAAGGPPLQNRLYRPGEGRWYWLSLAALVLAMLGKGSVVVLPVLLLGIVWWLRPLTKLDLVRTAPFFLVAMVLAGVNVWFQTHGSGRESRIAGFAERLLGAGGVVWFYLYKALLPVDLAFVYPQWHIEVGNLLWWLPLLAALALTVVLWWYRTGWSRPFLFTWGFFGVALAPVMGFTDVGFMRFSLVADHYQHIALIGVIALAAAGFSAWHQRSRGGLRWIASVVVFVAVGVLTFLTWRQSGLYCDQVTLYRETLEKNPECWIIHNNLAEVFLKTGQLQEAIVHFQQALRHKPNYPEAYNDLGVTLGKAGRLPEAITHFMQAIKLKPGFFEARINLSIALGKAGRLTESIEHYKQAVRLAPDDNAARVYLISAYARAGRSAEAVAAAEEALQIARNQGQTALAKQIENWLNAYLSAPQNPGTASPPDESTPPAP